MTVSGPWRLTPDLDDSPCRTMMATRAPVPAAIMASRLGRGSSGNVVCAKWTMSKGRPRSLLMTARNLYDRCLAGSGIIAC